MFKSPKRLVEEETWSSLVKVIPLSRYTSKRHKKRDEKELQVNHHASETTTTTPTKTASPSGGRDQRSDCGNS